MLKSLKYGGCVFLFFLILQISTLHAQYSISGKVLDAKTSESLAFANVTFNPIYALRGKE